MPVSPYFSPYGYKSEQNLISDLTAEVISMYGHDWFYIPRDTVHIDELRGEDIASNFKNAYPLEMMIENADGYEGQDLFQKFGFELRDEATVIVAKQRFLDTMVSTPHAATIKRPREGDLVFHPFSNALFEIMFVEHEQPFYVLNNLPVYRMNLSLFEYTNQDIDVDVVGLDIPSAEQTPGAGIEGESYMNKLTLSSAGTWTLGENVSQTIGDGVVVTGEIAKIADGGATIYVTHVSNNSTDDTYSVFATGFNVVGATSGESQNVTAVVHVMEDYAKNDVIDTIADGLLDVSNSNPFGNP